MMKTYCLSIDMDGARTLFKRNEDRDSILEQGTAAFETFVARHQITTTMFVVARDLEQFPWYREWVRRMAREGHEIGNHSYEHRQDTVYTTTTLMSDDVRRAHTVIEDAISAPVRGFRAPGWNISCAVLDTLEALGYAYDSSIFPTSVAPLLKGYYALTMRSFHERTLGPFRAMTAPCEAYFPARDAIHKRGERTILEIPIATSCGRLPFMGTFLLGIGLPSVVRSLNRYVMTHRSLVNFELHLTEFVDGAALSFDAIDSFKRTGGYVPPTLTMPLAEKLATYDELLRDWKQAGSIERLIDVAHKLHAERAACAMTEPI